MQSIVSYEPSLRTATYEDGKYKELWTYSSGDIYRRLILDEAALASSLSRVDGSPVQAVKREEWHPPVCGVESTPACHAEGRGLK